MIYCTLLGQPGITENNAPVILPNNKISALLYYIFLKKVVSRDEVAGIFWGDSIDERAKGSLRSAIHKIRKLFNSEIILTPNKTTLVLNETVDLKIDIEEFEKNPSENLHLYRGEFLHGFYVKDSIEFEYFISKNRSYYEDLFIQSSLESIKNDLKNQNTKNIETKIGNLLTVDTYNETAHIMMMKYYRQNGRYDKIINEYHNFKKLLEEDLGSSVGEEIKSLYKEALKKVGDSSKEKEKSSDIFYNRDYEISIIQKALDDFANNKKTRSILIRGEKGIGKSTLKKKIVQDNKDKFYIFETSCYHIEKEFTLSPWMKIISAIDHELRKNNANMPPFWEELILKLFPISSSNNLHVSKILENKENFNIELINNVLITAIKELKKHKKTLIVIENIYYADEQSLNFVVNLILNFSEDVMFLLTTTKEKRQKIDNLIISLKSAEKMVILDLERFSKQDVSIIVTEALGKEGITAKEINDIYDKSNGNTLFLNEYIDLYRKNKKDQVITEKLSELLDMKFSFLDEDEMNVVKTLSIFYKDISLDILMKVLDKNIFNLLKTLTSLQNKAIIQEYRVKNQTYLEFANSVYKDYVYSMLNMSEKQVLNEQIADIYEKQILPKSDVTEYVRLKYHYEQAGNEIKALKYDVHILNYNLNYNHEIFPNLDDHDLSRQIKTYIKNDKSVKLLQDLEANILKFKNQISNKQEKNEMDDIQILFLYCKGRYLIRSGAYSDGVLTIQRVIDLSKSLGNDDMLLAGYKQMIIYGIQINNTTIMKKYIIPAMKVCKKISADSDLGVLNRLHGLYHLMQGNLKEAEELFLKSIEIFTDSTRIISSNSISTAASYNYIGEIRKSFGMYKEAMDYFEKAINLCKDNGVMCLAIFYINAGKTLFLEGDIKNSKDYFLKAKDITVEFDSYWKSVIIDAFLALFYFLEKKYDLAISTLTKSLNNVKTLNNPKDIGLVYFVQTIIAYHMEKSKEKFGDMRLFLNEPCELYFYKSLEYLDDCRDNMEIEYLKSIIG